MSVEGIFGDVALASLPFFFFFFFFFFFIFFCFCFVIIHSGKWG